MSKVIESLRSLDRKERFAVVREALCIDEQTPKLDKGFREKLSGCVGVPVPEHAFVAMDYHLDWIRMSLHLAENPAPRPGEPFPNLGFDDINNDQEDIDLLVAFDSGDETAPATHLAMIEAKAYLPWTNEQLKSKTCRLGVVLVWR